MNNGFQCKHGYDSCKECGKNCGVSGGYRVMPHYVSPKQWNDLMGEDNTKNCGEAGGKTRVEPATVKLTTGIESPDLTFLRRREEMVKASLRLSATSLRSAESIMALLDDVEIIGLMKRIDELEKELEEK